MENARLTGSTDVNLLHPRVDDGVVRVVGHVGAVVAVRLRAVGRRRLAELDGAALLDPRLTRLDLLATRLLLGDHRSEVGELVVLHQGDVLLALLVLQVSGADLLLLVHRLLLLHVLVLLLHVLA